MNTVDSNTSLVRLKLLGVAALYALFLYLGELFFDGNGIVGNFEPASGFALAALLLGGKRHTFGIFFGATLIHVITGDSLWEAVVVASGDTLQAFCGAWLLRGGKFDLRLQSLQDYLRLILLGGAISVAIGALVVSTALHFLGWHTYGDYFHNPFKWFLSDTLGVILITPLILTWWQTKESWRKSGQLIEAILLLGMAVLLGQIVFLGWLNYGFLDAPKGYWMFLPITWVATRLGSRGASFALFVIALQALFGAIHGTGYFANDVAQTNLLNYFVYMLTLSIVGMALAAHLTEREGIENTLKLTKERYDFATAAGKVGTWDWNPVTGDLVWSDETFRLMGFTPGSVIPSLELYQGLVHPEDRKLFQNAVQAALNKAKPFNFDCRIVLASGKELVCNATGKVEFDAKDQPIRMLGTIQDISERKHAEQILTQHKKVLDTAIDGFWMVDARGNLLEANEAYEMISGYSADELKKMHISQLEAKEKSVEEVTAHMEKIITNGSDRFETRHRHKDGHEIDIEISTIFVPETQQFAVFVRDITERKEAEEEIHNLAFYDALTKLPNRRLLNDRLDQIMAASKRSGNYGALLFLDLDNFKPLNDTCGHGVGDLLLVEVANRLTGCVREVDTAARFGGDEFVVILSDLDEDIAESTAQAGNIAEKIRATLSNPYLLTFKQEGEAETAIEHRCAVSIGVVVFNSELSSENILKWADMAMYQAKEAGRNSIRFYDAKV